jgi:glutamine amidotransferase PdxT
VRARGDATAERRHPEIQGERRFHEYFLRKVRAASAAAA